MTTYTTAMMVDRTGATARQLGSWAAKGWLSAPAPGTVGTGRSREWSHYDLFRASLIVRFMKAGFRVEKAAALTKAIAERDALSRVNQLKVRIADNMSVVIMDIHGDSIPETVPVVGNVL